MVDNEGFTVETFNVDTDTTRVRESQEKTFAKRRKNGSYMGQTSFLAVLVSNDGGSQVGFGPVELRDCIDDVVVPVQPIPVRKAEGLVAYQRTDSPFIDGQKEKNAHMSGLIVLARHFLNEQRKFPRPV